MQVSCLFGAGFDLKPKGGRSGVASLPINGPPGRGDRMAG